MTPVRTLMLAENLPYPTFKGGDLRNWQNLNALVRIGASGVFGLCSNDHRLRKPSSDIAVWTSTSDPNLAVPAPPSRIAQTRRWLIDDDGHPCDSYYSSIAAAEFERAMAEFHPDVVVIERLWLHRYIGHAKRFGARVVLDAHNIEAELSRQLARADRQDPHNRKIRERLAQRTAAIERRAVRDVDQVWVCSGNDRCGIEREYLPEAAVRVVPNGVDVPRYQPDDDVVPADPSAPSVVFPAMFTYAPNAAGAQFLIDELMPLLRATGTAWRLVLAGSMPTPAMLEAAHADADIIVTGAVPDMRPFLHTATAVVVPLFEGSGTRYKILEALAARVPVVTTPMGADGLDVENETHVLIARTGADFAAAIERIRTDRPLVERLAREGHALVARSYSWQVASEAIGSAMKMLCTGETTS
jgi:glycosyltransferase involved in cell wall biosynthesis